MSSVSDTLASATASLVESASASASVAASTDARPASYKAIGVTLAVASGLLIGSSFILKKKGLLACAKKEGHVAGEGQPYLKSPLWWSGMVIMISGELMNLVAYSFADAILVRSIYPSCVSSRTFLVDDSSIFSLLPSSRLFFVCQQLPNSPLPHHRSLPWVPLPWSPPAPSPTSF
jgi:hypothetical protein